MTITVVGSDEAAIRWTATVPKLRLSNRDSRTSRACLCWY